MSYSSDAGLISGEIQTLQTQERHPNLNWANYPKEVDNKFRDKCLIALVVSKMQIKDTERYYPS